MFSFISLNRQTLTSFLPLLTRTPSSSTRHHCTCYIFFCGFLSSFKLLFFYNNGKDFSHVHFNFSSWLPIVLEFDYSWCNRAYCYGIFLRVFYFFLFLKIQCCWLEYYEKVYSWHLVRLRLYNTHLSFIIKGTLTMQLQLASLIPFSDIAIS